MKKNCVMQRPEQGIGVHVAALVSGSTKRELCGCTRDMCWEVLGFNCFIITLIITSNLRIIVHRKYITY